MGGGLERVIVESVERFLGVRPRRAGAWTVACGPGPGCVDMKGGLVIAVAALEALSEVGVDCDWTVIFNSDEETGSYHSEKALRAEAKRCLGRLLGIDHRLDAGGRGVVVGHACVLQQRSCHAHIRHSKWVGSLKARGRRSALSVAVMTFTARSDIRWARAASKGTASV